MHVLFNQCQMIPTFACRQHATGWDSRNDTVRFYIFSSTNPHATTHVSHLCTLHTFMKSSSLTYHHYTNRFTCVQHLCISVFSFFKFFFWNLYEVWLEQKKKCVCKLYFTRVIFWANNKTQKYIKINWRQ